MPNDSSSPSPHLVLDLIEAFRRSKVMFAAVELGVFDALEEKPRSAEELAAKLKTNTDTTGRLLDACRGLGLLTLSDGRFANTPAASIYLCRNSPHRISSYIRYSNDMLWKLWANLEDAVRDGTHRWKQTYGTDGPIFAELFRSEQSKREFLMGMHGFGMICSPRVVAAFDLGRFQRLVDLGGATGHLAIAACERYPSLRATVFDLPEAIGLAKEIIGVSTVADRVDTAAGDFFNDPLPKGDLYALGRILHDWTEEKMLRLLSRIYDHLPLGGGLLIMETLLDDDRGGPTWAHMQSLNMLVCTEGKERTLPEYSALLNQVGFCDVQGKRTGAPLDAILARKA